MKLYTEESGGLFAPIPGDVKGNVKCLSDGTIGVHGYVIASTVTEKRLFVDATEYQLNTPGYLDGLRLFKPENFSYLEWKVLVDIYGYVAFCWNRTWDGANIIYGPECVNCLLVDGATRERPSFWPEGY